MQQPGSGGLVRRGGVLISTAGCCDVRYRLCLVLLVTLLDSALLGWRREEGVDCPLFRHGVVDRVYATRSRDEGESGRRPSAHLLVLKPLSDRGWWDGGRQTATRGYGESYGTFGSHARGGLHGLSFIPYATRLVCGRRAVTSPFRAGKYYVPGYPPEPLSPQPCLAAHSSCPTVCTPAEIIGLTGLSKLTGFHTPKLTTRETSKNGWERCDESHRHITTL